MNKPTPEALAAAREWMDERCPHPGGRKGSLRAYCPECHAELLAVVEASRCAVMDPGMINDLMRALAALDAAQEETDA